MSLHQANKDKPRAQKCRHFCFSFDLHNYCPTCREAGKGDDPCVTFETPCQICTSFSDEQLKKIQNRKRYLKKQKAETSSKDDELDLLGEGDGDSFTGSNADLESAADNLFTSSPSSTSRLQSLGWIINQEKSELKPTQVFSFVGYEYHLDPAFVKPTQERWLKLQDLILRLTARCLMSLIGLLASTEKMVPEGRLHMRPFQFHLKEHWRYPQSLVNLSRWSTSFLGQKPLQPT